MTGTLSLQPLDPYSRVRRGAVRWSISISHYAPWRSDVTDQDREHAARAAVLGAEEAATQSGEHHRAPTSGQGGEPHHHQILFHSQGNLRGRHSQLPSFIIFTMPSNFSEV